ncbi:MAG: DNA polymerase III subunit gamma/tau [Oscillospiraceae bacterium]|nr:DNA polymerase III subunit gamma/tau [Oscillospiraceae bacterium]
MYKALYRKYRPQKFSDIVDQQHVTKTLKNEVRFSRMAHAYLFIGSKGTGKTSCARILAKSMNCLNREDGDACCKCEICNDFEKESLVDISELDAASNNSVEDIRSICENASFTPVKTKFRVYIIDEVHMLSQSAFAALLKTLEEPPKHVVFILATTEFVKLPATVVSRCQRFEFTRIRPESIAKKILNVSSLENINLKKEAAMLIARFADGALRDAFSLLDKFVGLKEEIDEKFANCILGFASKDDLYFLCNCILKNDINSALKFVDKIYMASKNIENLVQEILKIFRDIMLLKIDLDNYKILNLTENELEFIKKFSFKLSLQKVLFFMDIISECLKNIYLKADPKIEFEVCLVKLCTKYTTRNNRSLLVENNFEILTVENNKNKTKTQEKLEIEDNNIRDNYDKKNDFNINIAEPSKPKTTESEFVSKSTEKNSKADSFLEEDNLNSKIELKEKFDWNKILNFLKQQSEIMFSAFENSRACIKNGVVLVDTPKKIGKQFLNSPSYREKLRQAISSFSGMNLDIVSCDNTSKNGIENFIEKARKYGFKITEKN